MNEVERNPQPDSRRHDLDALRATAMLLGIMLHCALAYVTIPFWPVMDDSRSVVFDVLFSAVHGFRMPLFFVISGFFTAMLWRKRGIGGLAKHRFHRIFLPLIIFVIPMWIAMWGAFAIIGASGGDRNEIVGDDSIWTAARDNDVEQLNEILEATPEIDLNQMDAANKLPPLNWAALSGSAEAAAWLIEKGANIDVRSGDQTTPLGHAAFMGRPEVAQKLIEEGAELNSVSVYQATPLQNTMTSMGTVKWVAAEMELDFDEEKIQAGRLEVAEMLKAAEKENSRSEPETRETKNRDDRFGPVTNFYLAVADFWLFNVAPIFGHLWFLWFLCLLLVPFLIYASVASVTGWKGLPKQWFHFPLVLVWIVPLTASVQWFHGVRESGGFGPDTSQTIFPFPHTVLLYGIYFFFGVLYFDSDDRDGKASRFWWVSLPLGLLVCYPLGMSLIEEPDAIWIQNTIPENLVRPLAVVLQALFAWLLIFGMMGLFRRISSTRNQVIRYLSDSSYFLYLAHIPLVFLVQHFVKLIPGPALLKFCITCVVLTGLLLLVYEFAIRYTFIGTLLNGKRTRPRKPPA